MDVKEMLPRLREELNGIKTEQQERRANILQQYFTAPIENIEDDDDVLPESDCKLVCALDGQIDEVSMYLDELEDSGLVLFEDASHVTVTRVPKTFKNLMSIGARANYLYDGDYVKIVETTKFPLGTVYVVYLAPTLKFHEIANYME